MNFLPARGFSKFFVWLNTTSLEILKYFLMLHYVSYDTKEIVHSYCFVPFNGFRLLLILYTSMLASLKRCFSYLFSLSLLKTVNLRPDFLHWLHVLTSTVYVIHGHSRSPFRYLPFLFSIFSLFPFRFLFIQKQVFRTRTPLCGPSNSCSMLNTDGQRRSAVLSVSCPFPCCLRLRARFCELAVVIYVGSLNTLTEHYSDLCKPFLYLVASAFPTSQYRALMAHEMKSPT